jgi:hypothetical protein
MTDNQTPQPESSPQETEAAFSQKPTLKERISGLLTHPKAPYWFGTAVLVVAGAVAFHLKGPVAHLSPFGASIVTFDPVRFNNAQRAAASILIMRPDADAALTMTQVAKQAENVIREEAHGAVVLVRQTVVAPDGIPDITEAVLNRFGLPTNVPTITTDVKLDALEDVAPTDSAFSSGKLREDYRLELEAKRAKLAEKQAKDTGQANILP